MIGFEQVTVADRAGLNVNTIRSMEASGDRPIAGRAANVQAVQRVLEEDGAEFLNHGRPGVRLRAPDGYKDDELVRRLDRNDVWQTIGIATTPAQWQTLRSALAYMKEHRNHLSLHTKQIQTIRGHIIIPIAQIRRLWALMEGESRA